MKQTIPRNRQGFLRFILFGLIAVTPLILVQETSAQGRNDLQARNRKARIENRRQVQQQAQQARREQLARQQQFLREQQAQLNSYVLDRYYSVQDLWVVQMTLPNGYRFYQPYLGRSSAQAMVQARQQYPRARVDFVRRFNFRN